MVLKTNAVVTWLNTIPDIIQTFPPSPPLTEDSDLDPAEFANSIGTGGQRKRRMDTRGEERDEDELDTPRPVKKRNTGGKDIPILRSIPLGSSNASSVDGNELSEPKSPASSEAESHNSGRLSPTKQLRIMQQNKFVIPHDFDETNPFLPADVCALWEPIQELVDGRGFLHVNFDTQGLVGLDAKRLARPGVRAAARSETGHTLSITEAEQIIQTAREMQANFAHESDWNESVHHNILQAARNTSKHASGLKIIGVKSSKIDPQSLGMPTLPRRVIDYSIVLQDKQFRESGFEQLKPHPGTALKSWNHITSGLCERTPIAINVETKAPNKSWTDGIPQVGVWSRALMNRLDQIAKDFGTDVTSNIPSMPLVIVQGHDWHVLFVSRSRKDFQMPWTTDIWMKIPIGSTRDYHDFYKLMAVLHLLMDWAYAKWRPWFMSLIGQSDQMDP